MKEPKIKTYLLVIMFILSWFGMTAETCTRVIVYAKDYHTDPRKASYSTNQVTIIAALRESLKLFGYEIHLVDEERGKIISGWRPVESDSHYAKLFDRRDYGVSDGAYYQVVIDLIQEGPQVKVMVGTLVKSLAGRLESSGKVERRILDQLADNLRSPQIEMTNVGVTER